ncbi:hypothetical protein [Streptomyces chartreusis]|uniref:hypothetical protein n=1 Tax=Streptomyces chartreusis TaxID=1969 RepID=UPI0037CD26A6
MEDDGMNPQRKSYWDRIQLHVSYCLAEALASFDDYDIKGFYSNALQLDTSSEELTATTYEYFRRKASSISEQLEDKPKGSDWEEEGLFDYALLGFSQKHQLESALLQVAILSANESDGMELSSARAHSQELLDMAVLEMIDEYAPRIDESVGAQYARSERLQHAEMEWSDYEHMQDEPAGNEKRVQFSEYSQYAIFDSGQEGYVSPAESGESLATKPWDGSWGNRHRKEGRAPNASLPEEYGSLQEWADGAGYGWDEYLNAYVADEEDNRSTSRKSGNVPEEAPHAPAAHSDRNHPTSRKSGNVPEEAPHAPAAQSDRNHPTSRKSGNVPEEAPHAPAKSARQAAPVIPPLRRSVFRRLRDHNIRSLGNLAPNQVTTCSVYRAQSEYFLALTGFEKNLDHYQKICEGQIVLMEKGAGRNVSKIARRVADGKSSKGLLRIIATKEDAPLIADLCRRITKKEVIIDSSFTQEKEPQHELNQISNSSLGSQSHHTFKTSVREAAIRSTREVREWALPEDSNVAISEFLKHLAIQIEQQWEVSVESILGYTLNSHTREQEFAELLCSPIGPAQNLHNADALISEIADCLAEAVKHLPTRTSDSTLRRLPEISEESAHHENDPLPPESISADRSAMHLAEVWQHDITRINNENARVLKNTPRGQAVPLLLVANHGIVIIGEENPYYGTAIQAFENEARAGVADTLVRGYLDISRKGQGRDPGEITIYEIYGEFEEAEIRRALSGRVTKKSIVFR